MAYTWPNTTSCRRERGQNRCINIHSGRAFSTGSIFYSALKLENLILRVAQLLQGAG